MPRRLRRAAWEKDVFAPENLRTICGEGLGSGSGITDLT
jgi:hypothetical protein